jgi:hypothetical protein
MAFAYSAAVAGVGTVSCAGTTTVIGVGTNFGVFAGTARLGGTITVGGVTKTIVAIASTTSLTTDTAFGTFTGQAYTGQKEVVQTGADTMGTSLGAITGFDVTNRGDQLRIFDSRGVDLTINGVLTVDSTTGQLRNNTTTSGLKILSTGSASAELIINGRRASANNGPFPYAGLDWLGNNGSLIMQLQGTATYPAKLTLKDACIRYGADWLSTNSGQFSTITTEGETCWILNASGSGTSQARLRLNNTTPSINFTAKKTYVGVWLNFGVPQTSLKGYTPIATDGPEINLASVAVASRIIIEDYDTTYVQAAYYVGSKINLYGGAWVRLKNNLVGSNFSWQQIAPSNRNVIELSKQITIRQQDSAGNLLSDGYMYYQPVGSNVAGIRAKGGASDITFDLTQQNILTASGVATSEFVYAWDYANTGGLTTGFFYFCTGQTQGAETHSVGSSRYGYDKQYTTVNLAGNGAVSPTYVHASLPTSSKVIATAQAITGIAFNFATKVMTITGNLTYQQIYDAYQYALNTTANLFQADNCLTANSTSNYVGWIINIGTGVTISAGSGNFTKLQAQTITLTGTAQITGIYQDSTGTSTVLQISGFDAGSAVFVEDNNAIEKFYSASASGTVTVYIPPTGTGSWYYAVEKYGIQRQSDFFTFSGGLKEIVVKAIPDTGITVSNSTTVAAYTELNTPDKIYDYVAYLRLSVPHISYGQITFKNGTSLDLQDASMLVNQSAAAVASFNYTTKLLTIKSTSLSTGVTYDKIITTPPETIEADTDEVISVNIEDANGDSSVTIQGGSGNFTLWKIPNATSEDNYATGVNLGTVTNITYRFLSAPGFKIVIRDNTTGFRQVVPMDKGNYTRGLFFGDQVQLAQSQEVSQINTKVDTVLVDLTGIKGTGFTKDTHSLINIKLAVDALENYDDTLTQTKLDSIQDTVDNISVDFTPVLNAVDALPTLTEIEASSVLAKEAAATANKDAIIAAIGTGGGGSCDLTEIEADLVSIKASVDTIQVSTNKMTFDGHYINAVAKVVEDKANYTLTPDEKVNIANAVQAAILNETDGQKILEAIVNAIGNENIDQVALVAAIRADIERTGGMLAGKASEANATTNKNTIVSAIGTPLQASSYTAPDNATIAKINDVKAKTDNLPANPASSEDVAALGTSLSGNFDAIPTKEEISTEVWENQPERLTRVSTVETTGDQIAAFND